MKPKLTKALRHNFYISGYGDIVPGSLVEQCLAAVVGLIGLLILNYIVSQMSATLSGENANR